MADRPGNPTAGEQPDPAPSKSARKRQMHALQALGEALVNLSEKQLAIVPIDNEGLVQAIALCRQIRSNSARKRQLQFIGRLMREVDPEPIERALATLHESRQRDTSAFHEVEQLRDEVLASGPAGVELVIARWPEADRQQLRQWVLQHEREQLRGKAPAASRKLFRYLRELQQRHAGSA